jgi:hypothetical protein
MNKIEKLVLNNLNCQFHIKMFTAQMGMVIWKNNENHLLIPFPSGFVLIGYNQRSRTTISDV